MKQNIRKTGTRPLLRTCLHSVLVYRKRAYNVLAGENQELCVLEMLSLYRLLTAGSGPGWHENVHVFYYQRGMAVKSTSMK